MMKTATVRRATMREAIRAFVVGALLAGSTSLLPAQSASGNARRCATCDTSSAARQRAERDLAREISRLRRELDGLERQRMTALHVGTSADVDSTLRALRPLLARVNQELMRAQVQLAEQVTVRMAGDRQLPRMSDDAPERATLRGLPPGGASGVTGVQAMRPGYFGVVYSASTKSRVNQGAEYVRYLTYPVVLSVEAGSPAERAGIGAGDTVIKYDGLDLRRTEIAMTHLLQPGRMVSVQVKRGAEVRDVTVRVAPRPPAGGFHYSAGPGSGGGRARIVGTSPAMELEFELAEPDGAAPTRMETRADRTQQRPPRSARAESQPAPPAPPSPASPPAPGHLMFGGSRWAVGGAEIVRMSSDLQEAFGVSQGVLVLSVGSGTPAARAGLRGGDVILRAAGRDVQTPQTLQRAVQEASGRTIELRVIRKGEERTIVLRW